MDTNLVDQIRERWLRIQEKISNAANKAKRNPNDITVVVVSKLQAIEKVEAAVQCGLSIFGENYPELAVEKIIHFVSNPVVNWHMIGHIQSRKIPVVASHFHMVHSLDSIKAAEKLNKELQKCNRSMPVLLEVNTSQEESKAGWEVDDDNFNFWVDQVGYISELHNIMIRGLMSMPPYYTDGELSRPYFARLNHLRDKLQNHFPEITHLSMGTSQDYEVAVEEGATFLRIGTAIMGKRG